MAVGDSASSIQVVVRVRPFTIREAAQLTRIDDGPLFLGDGSLAAVPVPKLAGKGLRSVIKVVDDKCLVFDPPEDNPVHRFSRSVVPQGKRVKDQTFGFDRVFDDNATQNDIYDATTRTLLDSVLDGYNATVFAYGATGCGKTHTITGTAQQPGIIFMTMQELFEKVDDLRETKESEITLSYLEIYNETIRDLLNPGAGTKQGLMLREDANQAVSVAGLSSHKPQNVQEVMDMVIRGNAARTQSPTEANATSSRSHAVLQINVSLKLRDTDVHEPVTMATLSIIDLAGSERASATKNRGERLLEGANINKSLLALGSCINALCDARKTNHVPYRNSKLTRLLKFSLGGNCRTVMIVCVSPSSQHFDETQNTLRYANRAKNIQTKSVRNVYNVDRHVKDYLKKIDEQMARINELTAQQKQYEELAFAKFQKARSKTADITHEGIRRIRTAYDNSKHERDERTAQVQLLRQIERRMCEISRFIGAYDDVCEEQDGEELPMPLPDYKRKAEGIFAELDISRKHCSQKIDKNNWDRAIKTALSDGLRQLQNLDDYMIGCVEETLLENEVKHLKGQVETEMYRKLFKREDEAEDGTIQDHLKTLVEAEGGMTQDQLKTLLEQIAVLNQTLLKTEEEDARSGLEKLFQSSVEAIGKVVNGGLQVTQITRAVPPTRSGTPRKRKQTPTVGRTAVPAHMTAEMEPSTQLRPSPVRMISSPRRRVVKFGGQARRGVNLANGGTPRTKSPSKKSPKKRAVRWKDEGDDAGELVEYQPTPKALDRTPPAQHDDTLFNSIDQEDTPDSSPLPNPDIKSTSSRFAPNFLAKKPDRISPPSLNPEISTTPSDNSSPLREMETNRAPHLTRLRPSLLPQRSPSSSPMQDRSRDENSPNLYNITGADPLAAAATSEKDLREAFQANKKRSSSLGSITGGGGAGGAHSSSTITSIHNPSSKDHHRRRSPTASSSSGTSPPAASSSTDNPGDHHPNAGAGGGGAGIFSASHARRMVRSEREDGTHNNTNRGVLSPRTQAVVKTSSSAHSTGGAGGAGGRRSTLEAPGSSSGNTSTATTMMMGKGERPAGVRNSCAVVMPATAAANAATAGSNGRSVSGKERGWR